MSSSSWSESSRPSRAELDDVALDLARRSAAPSRVAGRRGGVAHGDEVLDLERGQRAGDLVEPHLVALEGGQRLVGARQDRGGVLEDVAAAGDVERDDVHRLADRDHRVPGLLGDSLGGAVPGAHLVGGDAWSRASGERRPGGSGSALAPRMMAPSILASSRSRVAEELDVERRSRRCRAPRRLCRSRGRPVHRCGRAGCARARRAVGCRARRWRACHEQRGRRRWPDALSIGATGELSFEGSRRSLSGGPWATRAARRAGPSGRRPPGEHAHAVGNAAVVRRDERARETEPGSPRRAAARCL